MARGRKRLTGVAAALALMLGLAACSDGGGDDKSASNAGAPVSLAKATDVYAPWYGGRPGQADKSRPPVTIGFVNDEGGIPSFPEGSVAAEAAAKFINERLGGIDGAPVKLDVCKVAGHEEQGQACAQRFLGNDDIAVIAEDSLVVGAQTFHETLGGRKPVVIGSPNAIADAHARNAYPIGAGVFGTNPGFVYYAHEVLDAKKVSLLFPADDPTGQVAARQIKASLEEVGIQTTTAGYKSTATDMLPVVQASGAPQADATIGILPSPPTCIAGAKALQQAGIAKPVLGLSLCIADPVKDALGDYPEWTYVSISTNPALAGDDPMTDAYVSVMEAYAPEDANTGGFAPHAFSAVLTAAKMTAEAGGPTASSAAISKQLERFTGPTPMLPPTLEWGLVPSLEALGTIQTRLYTYGGDGDWEDAADGQWVPTGS